MAFLRWALNDKCNGKIYSCLQLPNHYSDFRATHHVLFFKGNAFFFQIYQNYVFPPKGTIVSKKPEFCLVYVLWFTRVSFLVLITTFFFFEYFLTIVCNLNFKYALILQGQRHSLVMGGKMSRDWVFLPLEKHALSSQTSNEKQ